MNKLILTFLSQLEYRFDILFKNDQVHKDLIRKSLKFYKVNTFIHIIEACIGRISKKTCKTCAKRQLEKSLSYISMHGKYIAILFSSYFNCDLKTSLELFLKFKCAIFTQDGMHLFDHMSSTLFYLKCINDTETEENSNFQKVYFGGYYFNSEPIELFDSSLNFIKNDEKFKKICYYGLLGDPFQPIHFFAIFVDKNINTIFIYNSSPINQSKYKFKKKLKNFNFVLNMYQNQFNNELCAFFALYFIEKMTKSKNSNDCFEKYFNQKKNMDKIIENYQKTCVFPARKNYKLVDFFFNDWDRY